MLFNNLLFWTSVCALQSHPAYAIHPAGKRSLNIEQVPLSSSNEALTINVQADSSVARAAEIAILDVLVSAGGFSDDAALEEARNAAFVVESFLTELSNQAKSPVETWFAFPARVASDNSEYQNRRVSYGCDHVNIGQNTDEHTATARFTIRINKLTSLEYVNAMLASYSQVKIKRVQWELTEQTLAAAKTELRAKAVDDAKRAGDDYARAFGASILKPLQLDEDYSHSFRRLPGSSREEMYWEEPQTALEPMEIVLKTTVKCTFSTQ